MAPAALVIYSSDGFYEPGNKWFFESPGIIDAALAQAIADSHRAAIAEPWAMTRWEKLNASGVKLDEGSLSGAGTFAGDILPPKFCAFLRLTSAGPGRPSSKYLHGLTENAMGGGQPAAGWLVLVSALINTVVAAGGMDSDGEPLTGYAFRQFSRRRHVRRVSE